MAARRRGPPGGTPPEVLLQQVRVGPHFRSRTRYRRSAWPSCKHACSLNDFIRGNAGRCCNFVRGKPCYLDCQFFEAIDMFRAKFLVVQFLCKYYADNGTNHCGILSRANLQVQVRPACDFSHAWIYTD